MKNKEVTIKLINEAINETLSTYADNPTALNDYSWGWRSFQNFFEHYSVGPNNATVFHCVDKVIRILQGTGVQWYLNIEPNAKGEPTPCVSFF